MIELTSQTFSAAVPLFLGTDYGSLVFGTLLGPHPGRVFVDDSDDPKAGLVCTRAGIGYYFLAGAPDDRDLAWLRDAFARDFIPAQKAATGSPEVLLFFYPQVKWREALFQCFEGRRPIEIFKHRFTLPIQAAERLRGWQQRVPEGFRVAPFNRAILKAHPGIAEEICLFYGSVDVFLEQDLGVCVMDGDRLASTCYAVFTGSGEAEISIATQENYRRKGLAQIAAAAFIEASLDRKLDPIWGCWPNNAPSVALAQKLGFVEAARQPVCLWIEGD